MTLYKVIASNGQVLAHSLEAIEALDVKTQYEIRYKEDIFKIEPYRAGDYYNDYIKMAQLDK